MSNPTPAKIWDGVFASFAEAKADDTVFMNGVWLDKITERARSAIAASANEHAIAPVAETRDYALPFVAAMAAKRSQRLRILDFGGGIATSYLSLAAMLPYGQPLDFVVVENETICRQGRELFANDSRVSFRTDIPQPDGIFDIVHCGSSLHYVDDWQDTLQRLAALSPGFILFADLPASDNQSFVTAQAFHGRRIPVRFWNLGEFIARVEAFGYELIFKSRYRGTYRDAMPELPTGHFDPAHRLTYMSQLVFRRAD